MENKQVIVIGGVRGGKSEAIQKEKEMLQNENVEFVDYGCVSEIVSIEYICTNDIERLKAITKTTNNLFAEFNQTIKLLTDNSKPTKQRHGSNNGSFENKLSKRRSKNKAAKKSKMNNRK